MTKRCLASFAVAVALLASRAASAQTQYTSQPDSPQWLSDRRYNEGIGIRTGDLELHPGIAGEAGYDSNWFLRSTRVGVDNGPPLAPVIPALEFRISPSLYLSTIGPRRREGDMVSSPPSVAFRGGINATYREFIGLSSDSSQPQNDVSGQRNLSVGADARLDILPERPWGAGLFASYARIVQPNATTADANLAYTRDDVGVGGELVTQPGGGTLDWHFGYQFREALFEQSPGVPFGNMTHEAFTRGRWKFRPRTALIYDATLRFLSYLAQDRAARQGLVNSTPVRMRIGLNGLIGERFAALALVGWGASFYDTVLPSQPQYDSVIAQAELKWFLAANPGATGAGDLGLALSSLALGYTRDFQNSYLGNFYGNDRGYLRFNYFFAGRALVTLEGGVGAIEYPNIYWLTLGPPRLRHSKFTDVRADATLFSEYRATDTFGINATLRYTANFSQTHDVPGSDTPNPGVFDMAWNRFEAFVGVRWFM